MVFLSTIQQPSRYYFVGAAYIGDFGCWNLVTIIYHIPSSLHHPGYRRGRRKCGNFYCVAASCWYVWGRWDLDSWIQLSPSWLYHKLHAFFPTSFLKAFSFRYVTYGTCKLWASCRCEFYLHSLFINVLSLQARGMMRGISRFSKKTHCESATVQLEGACQ